MSAKRPTPLITRADLLECDNLTDLLRERTLQLNADADHAEAETKLRRALHALFAVVIIDQADTNTSH